MDSLRLYQRDISRYAARVRIVCYAKGLSVEKIDPRSGDHEFDYRAINPNGKIPCLDHAHFILPESETICEYLEEVFPDPSLLPKDPKDRARARLLARMSDLYLSPPLAKLIALISEKARPAGVGEAVDAAFAELEKVLAWFPRYFEGPTFAVAHALSLADCALAPCFFSVDSVAHSFHRHSPLPAALQAYLDKISGVPAVALVMEELRVALAQRRHATRSDAP